MEGLISSKINPETIVEAIDALRARKARPDKTRICYHLERKYGYSRDSVLSQLSNLVTSGKILKVKYKDYYSYRNPAAKKSGGKKKLLTTKQKGLSVINSNTSETKQLIGDLINSLQLSSISTRSTSETATTKSISSRLTSNSKIPSSSMLMSDKGTVSRSSSSIGDLLMVNSLFNCDDTNSSGKGLICLNTVGFNSVEEINIDREKSPANDSDYHDNSPDYQDNLNQRNGLKYVSKNKKLPTNSLGNDIASSSRKTEELPLQRARPVSQRKKIKKSLGPDFLDPSDLGYGYLKDTYEPKCYYCDYPVTSARSDKHLTCCKCNLKAHRRCLIPEAENMDIPEDEWLCEKCATICLYCGLSTETEPMMSCTKCDTPFHILCIQLYSDQLKAPYTCLQCVDSSGVNDVRDLAKENNNNNNRMNRFNSSSSISVNSNDANDLVNKKLATDKPVTKLNTVSTVSPIKNQVNNGTLMNNNSNNNSNNSSNDNFHSFISAKLAKIIKSFSIDPDPKNWTPSDVETYVREIGFPEQAPLFKEQLIDGRSLLLLRRMDVLRGLSIKLGPALKIYAHINQLQGSDLPLIENDLPKSQSSSKLNQF